MVGGSSAVGRSAGATGARGAMAVGGRRRPLLCHSKLRYYAVFVRKKQIWRRKKGCQILWTWPATTAKFGVRQILFRKKQDLRFGSRLERRISPKKKKKDLADLRQSPIYLFLLWNCKS